MFNKYAKRKLPPVVPPTVRDYLQAYGLVGTTLIGSNGSKLQPLNKKMYRVIENPTTARSLMRSLGSLGTALGGAGVGAYAGSKATHYLTDDVLNMNDSDNPFVRGTGTALNILGSAAGGSLGLVGGEAAAGRFYNGKLNDAIINELADTSRARSRTLWDAIKNPGDKSKRDLASKALNLARTKASLIIRSI